MIHRILVFLFALFSFFSHTQQLIINEVSQGTGTAEYVEFVVIGTPGCQTPAPCIDIRHVIIDDNNGYFQSGSGAGTAPGAVRFSNDPLWSCVPQGTYIVIYNEANRNTAIPPDDISLSDGNCRLILPASSPLLEGTPSEPNNSTPLYPPAASWTVGAGSWSSLAMNNSNDSFQIPNLAQNGTPLHAVSWGNNSNNTIIYFSGSASGTVFSFTNDTSNDWNLQSNWSSGNVGTDETPGAANSVENDAFIASMNPQCGIAPSLQVSFNVTDESCTGTCDGSITATAGGGNAPYTYSWSNGMSGATITGLCSGTYTLTVTDNSGCTYTEATQVNSGSVSGDPTITDPGNLLNTQNPVQLTAATSGGTWSSDCGSCLTSGGVFDPQTSGVGTFQVCYTLGSGNCTVQDCIDITVSEDCQPQQTSETRTICPGSSTVIFGQTESTAGVYSQTFTDVNGCDSTHSVTLTFYAPQQSSETIQICPGSTTDIFGQQEGNEGVYSQTFTDVHGCDSVHEITLVHFQPQNTIESMQICPGSSTTIFGQVETDEGTYTQLFTDANGCDSSHAVMLSFYQVSDSYQLNHFCAEDSVALGGVVLTADTIVTVTETDNHGCTYSAVTEFVLDDCQEEEFALYIPNVFTPNADGINDLFTIELLGAFLEEGYIFNRWGNQVHSFSDSDKSWDGTFNGQTVSDGVYTYVIYFTRANGNRDKVHGFVTVLR